MYLLKKCIEDFTAAYKIPVDTVDLDKCISWAVDKAYGDMMPRTIKGHTEDIKKESAAVLTERFREYFNAPPPSEKGFESVHKEVCDVFLTSFNKAAKKIGIQEQAFGKAQKIVNMSFKYLYCMLRGEKARWFSYCHMPLDTYTLNWFYRKEEKKEKEEGIKPSKKETWSNLKPKQYYSMANKIRSYVKEDTQFSGLSPLEAEFIIWPIEKSMVSLKELKSAISRSCSDQIITVYLGKECTKALQEIGKAEALTFEKAYGYAKQE